MDNKNLCMAVSFPNLNFNFTRHVTFGNQVNADERFYSVSMGVEIQLI